MGNHSTLPGEPDGRGGAVSLAPPLGPPGLVAPRVGTDRPRLVVVEGLEVSTPLDPYLTLRALGGYSGCSPRWLRDRLSDPYHPLPHYRVEGKILVRRSEFDTWMSQYRKVGHPDVESVVSAVLSGLDPRLGPLSARGA